MLVVVGGYDRRGPLAAGGLDRCVDRRVAEHDPPEFDDLIGAAMVDGQPDHLDAGEAIRDVDEQRRVGAGEAVDRLRRIADEEHVVATRPNEVDEPVLERVQVLGLVDEQVAEPPAQRLRERRIALGGIDREREQVVEVDDPP